MKNSVKRYGKKKLLPLQWYFHCCSNGRQRLRFGLFKLLHRCSYNIQSKALFQRENGPLFGSMIPKPSIVFLSNIHTPKHHSNKELFPKPQTKIDFKLLPLNPKYFKNFVIVSVSIQTNNFFHQTTNFKFQVSQNIWGKVWNHPTSKDHL